MILLADSQKASEGHDRVGHPARLPIHHEVMDVAEPLTCTVVYSRALHLVGSDQPVVSSVATERFAVGFCIVPSTPSE
jgi:hypothetical protein